MNSSSGSDAIGAGLGIGVILLVYGLILFVVLAIYYKIISKAGYSGWWCLLAFVPCANLIGLLIFAFNEWPIERELKQWRSSVPQPGAYPRYTQHPPHNQPPYNPPPANPDPPSYQV